MAYDVFISVGTPFTDDQENFVSEVEKKLKIHDLKARALDRSEYVSNEQPLKYIRKVMMECSGTVIIAFERKYIRDGLEKRDSKLERRMTDERLPTVWNQIEAAQAYMLDHPLLVIVEHGLHSEGLLEKGYDWNLHWVELNAEALYSPRFDGIFEDWKQRVQSRHEAKQKSGSEATELDAAKLTPRQLKESLTVGQWYGAIAAIVAVLSAVAYVAYKLGEAGVF